MVTMIGYGPEADFSDNPKAPKWVAKVRFKTTAVADPRHGRDGREHESRSRPGRQQQPPQQPRKKRRGFGLGEILGGDGADPALGEPRLPLVEN